MKKIVFIIILLFLLPIFLFGERIDDLKSKLIELETSGEKIVEQLNLSFALAQELQAAKQNKDALVYYRQALAIAQSLKSYARAGVIATDIAMFYKETSDYNKSIEYYQIALKTRKNAKDVDAISGSYNALGVMYSLTDDYSRALDALSNSLQLKQKSGTKKDISYVLNLIGNVHLRAKNYDKALDYYLQTSKIREKLPDRQDVAASLTNIGLVYKELKNYDKAILNYQLALAIFQEINKRDEVAYTQTLLGNIQLEQKHYEKALEYYQQALDLRKDMQKANLIAASYSNMGIVYDQLGMYNKAIAELNKALDLHQQVKNQQGISYAYSLLGRVYDNSARHELAIQTYQKSLQIKEVIGDNAGYIETLLNLGNQYATLHNFKQSKHYITKAMQLSQQNNLKNRISDCYFAYYKLYKGVNNYKNALDYYQKHSDLKRSLLDNNQRQRINDLQMVYEQEKKNKEIKFLQQCNDLQSMELIKAEANRNYYLLAAISVFVLLVLLLIMYLMNQRANTVLAAKNLLISNKNKELAILNQELKESNASKDRFFSIIAHDLKNPFTVLIGVSELLKTQIGVLETHELREYLEMIHDSSERTFNLLQNLLQWSRSQTGIIKMNKETIDFNNLSEETIGLLSHMAKTKGIELYTDIARNSYVRADKNMLMTVLRNLISNSIKYCKAGGNVKVSTSHVANMLEITVADTGVGMSADDLDKLFKIDKHLSRTGTNNEQGTGLGLILCKEFIEKNGGNIEATSTLGAGSCFTFCIPRDN